MGIVPGDATERRLEMVYNFYLLEDCQILQSLGDLPNCCTKSFNNWDVGETLYSVGRIGQFSHDALHHAC